MLGEYFGVETVGIMGGLGGIAYRKNPSGIVQTSLLPDVQSTAFLRPFSLRSSS